MLTYLCFNFLILFCSASVIPLKPQQFKDDSSKVMMEDNTRNLDQIMDKWDHHIQDFVSLVDGDRLMEVIFKYIEDPELINVIGFLGSTQFKDIVLEVESVKEFKEAVNYLELKGYDVRSVIELFNTLLELQTAPVEQIPTSNNKTVTKFIHEIIQILPIDQMKKLFKEKLEMDPDVAELYETLTTEEFKDILKRFSKNPKVLQIKMVFEGFGLDFDDLRSLIVDVVDDDVITGDDNKIETNGEDEFANL